MGTGRITVGVPRETFPGETRIALVPQCVPVLQSAGIEVVVEAGAGDVAGYPGEAFVGNAYVDPDVEHIPSTLVEAIDLFEHSEVAKAAFGEEVHQHLLNSAEQEWLAFNRAVTDWELRRNFEQL